MKRRRERDVGDGLSRRWRSQVPAVSHVPHRAKSGDVAGQAKHLKSTDRDRRLPAGCEELPGRRIRKILATILVVGACHGLFSSRINRMKSMSPHECASVAKARTIVGDQMLGEEYFDVT